MHHKQLRHRLSKASCLLRSHGMQHTTSRSGSRGKCIPFPKRVTIELPGSGTTGHLALGLYAALLAAFQGKGSARTSSKRHAGPVRIKLRIDGKPNADLTINRSISLKRRVAR